MRRGGESRQGQIWSLSFSSVIGCSASCVPPCKLFLSVGSGGGPGGLCHTSLQDVCIRQQKAVLDFPGQEEEGERMKQVHFWASRFAGLSSSELSSFCGCWSEVSLLGLSPTHYLISQSSLFSHVFDRLVESQGGDRPGAYKCPSVHTSCAPVHVYKR